ncbi:uncharacterized protein BDZ99DRAFT_391589 [Mytilinidion resinicola]|uniref:Uncharacterized protein n=1 Tax=Mytilinidion resinicola TaxID=574789 RepID=A0A6A6YIJ5_9PEZI|nr:uncharacterized protein BDZ99DRAFT_391589 [Mytilinidion resinicola]KAF2807814.1 hypothetical protein BDZ99DRAFT_391589 [Mytilinidion resinicola]
MTFFLSFADFTVYADKANAVNFGRLGFKRGWRLNSKTWRRNWRACFGNEYRPELNPYADSFFAFFACFPGFKANATAPMAAEFDRLASYMAWTKQEAAIYRTQAWNTEFERAYGTDASKLEGWKALCEKCSIEPAPQSVKKCKKALANVHVNLCDLADAWRTGEKVKLFPSFAALRRYTIPARIFPLTDAKADGYAKALLKKFFLRPSV